MARRAVVPRPGKQHGAPLGPRAGHQAADAAGADWADVRVVSLHQPRDLPADARRRWRRNAADDHTPRVWADAAAVHEGRGRGLVARASGDRSDCPADQGRAAEEIAVVNRSSNISSSKTDFAREETS